MFSETNFYDFFIKVTGLFGDEPIALIDKIASWAAMDTGFNPLNFPLFDLH